MSRPAVWHRTSPNFNADAKMPRWTTFISWMLRRSAVERRLFQGDGFVTSTRRWSVTAQMSLWYEYQFRKIRTLQKNSHATAIHVAIVPGVPPNSDRTHARTMTGIT